MGEAGSDGGYTLPNPNVWLGLSIAATLLCCTPFGVVGIVYAALAIEARNREDIGMWEHRVRLARNWTIAAIVGGLLVIVCAVVLQLQGLNDLEVR